MNRYKYLSEKDFKALVTGLMKDRKVYGTIRKDGFPAYARITSFEELTLAQTPTHLSAKEFLFPQRETLLSFDIAKRTHEAVVNSDPQAIIGLHPCDVKAIGLMDKVFSYGTPDANYLARRANTLIIGTDCMPDEYCFCQSLGNSEADEGFDLFIHAVRKGYLVRVGTPKGEEALLAHARTREPKPAELKELEWRRNERDASFKAKLEVPPEELPGIYAESNDSPVWEKIGAICYGCGSCNNVCPTCYCFDIKDEVRADLKGGQRVRVWDGCTLEDFAKVAGGHNFRKTRSERLRHRFNRKFRYLTDKFDSLFCVGCGRCSRTCLVKINIVEVTNELIRESLRKGD